jgi:muconolactone D-isomerase
MEFLVEIEVRLPHTVSDMERTKLIAAERVRGSELAGEGTIRAIWRVPGRFANCGIWSASDATALHSAISSLPLFHFLDVRVTPLARHNLSKVCLGLPLGLDVDVP